LTDQPDPLSQCSGRTRDPELLQRSLEWGNGKDVRKGDLTFVFGAVASRFALTSR
jgi:hypothetical protein